jgi:hypothetical protein
MFVREDWESLPMTKANYEKSVIFGQKSFITLGPGLT